MTKVDFDISQGDGKVARFMDLMNTQQYFADAASGFC